MAASIAVKLSNGTQHTVACPEGLDISVEVFKGLAADTIDIPADTQRIVYRGKVLKNGDNLIAVGVQDGHTMHIVRSQRAVPTTAATVSTPAPAPAPVSAPIAVDAGATAANPYAALLGGASGAGGMGAAPNNGLGAWPGMGMDMGAMGGPGAMPNAEQAQQMMGNPAMMQMAQQMMAQNPDMMNQIMAQHPMMQNMPPEQREAVGQLMRNPQAMQGLMAMSGGAGAAQGMGPPGGGSMPAFPGMPAPGGGGAPLGGGGGAPLGGGGAASFGIPPVANPREAYAEQLTQLQGMGFPNEEANIAALQMSQGNVAFAVDRLLGQ